MFQGCFVEFSWGWKEDFFIFGDGIFRAFLRFFKPLFKFNSARGKKVAQCNQLGKTLAVHKNCYEQLYLAY